MNSSAVYDRVFEDQTVQAPVLTISYMSDFSGWTGLVCHTVSEVIYSAFDKLFAAYVYATTGNALPRARVETVLISPDGTQLRRVVSGCRTVLEALIQIGKVAAPEGGRDFIVTRGARGRHLREREEARPVRLDSSHFKVMETASELLAEIADTGLSRVTATLDGVTVQPPEGGAAFCEIDLARALATFPSRSGGESIRVPLMNFRLAAADNGALRARLREMQESVAAARRMAVDEFGAACDLEVTRLSAALAGRRIEGRAAEVTGELVDRLVAAFGRDLRGLSPHARLVALDWIEAGIAVKLITFEDAA